MYEPKPRGCRGAESKKRSRARWVHRRRELARAHRSQVDAAKCGNSVAAVAPQAEAAVQAGVDSSARDLTSVRGENHGGARDREFKVSSQSSHPLRFAMYCGTCFPQIYSDSLGLQEKKKKKKTEQEIQHRQQS